ncbi:hypothetical protein, partial [Pseudomonas gessardii]|uniref:hypothetical protein n=1 Tax=Pseudomonas gessardii TaxID=78544 RepID=UPI001F2F61D5
RVICAVRIAYLANSRCIAVPERLNRGPRQESGAILISFSVQGNFFIFQGRCDFSASNGETMAIFVMKLVRLAPD